MQQGNASFFSAFIARFVSRSWCTLFLEIRNAKNLMKHLHQESEVSDVEYRVWKKQKKIG